MWRRVTGSLRHEQCWRRCPSRRGLDGRWRRVQEAGTAWDFRDTLALWLALTGNLADAARLKGFVDATYEVAGQTRRPNEARLRAMTFERLTRVLGVGLLNGVRQAGARLAEGDAFGIALARLVARGPKKQHYCAFRVVRPPNAG